METLIYYAAGREEKQKRMERLAKRLGCSFRVVYPIQTGQQIGFLAGLSGYAERKLSVLELPPKIEDEMLILNGFSGKKLDGLLAALREENLTVALKAVVTEHNVGWTFAALYAEIVAERAEMMKRAGGR